MGGFADYFSVSFVFELVSTVFIFIVAFGDFAIFNRFLGVLYYFLYEGFCKILVYFLWKGFCEILLLLFVERVFVKFCVYFL